MSLLKRKKDFKYHLKKSFTALYLSAAIVLVWRGLGGLVDYIYHPTFPELSYIAVFIVGFCILYLPDHNLDELLILEDKDKKLRREHKPHHGHHPVLTGRGTPTRRG